MGLARALSKGLKGLAKCLPKIDLLALALALLKSFLSGIKFRFFNLSIKGWKFRFRGIKFRFRLMSLKNFLKFCSGKTGLNENNTPDLRDLNSSIDAALAAQRPVIYGNAPGRVDVSMQAGMRYSDNEALVDALVNQVNAYGGEIDMEATRQALGVPAFGVVETGPDPYAPKKVVKLKGVSNLDGYGYVFWDFNREIGGDVVAQKADDRRYDILLNGDVVTSVVEPSIRLDGLTNGREYFVGVREVNGDEIEGPIEEVALTPHRQHAIPSPSSLTATSYAAEVNLAWDIPARLVSIARPTVTTVPVLDGVGLTFDASLLPTTHSTSRVVSVIRMFNVTRGFEYDISGMSWADDQSWLKLNPLINPPGTVLGDEVSFSYDLTFENMSTCMVQDVLTLTFTIMNTRLTPLTPLISVSRVFNITRGETYSVTDLVIEDNKRSFSLSLAANPGLVDTLDTYDEIEVDYTYQEDLEIINFRLAVDVGNGYSPYIPIGLVTRHTQFVSWDGLNGVRVRLADRFLGEDEYWVSFVVGADCTVYLGVDIDMTPIPRWLSAEGWTKTDCLTYFQDGLHTLSLWRKGFHAGDRVKLNGNLSKDFHLDESSKCSRDRLLREQFPFTMFSAVVRPIMSDLEEQVVLSDIQCSTQADFHVMNYGESPYLDVDYPLGVLNPTVAGLFLRVGDTVCFRMKAEAPDGSVSDYVQVCAVVETFEMLLSHTPEWVIKGDTLYISMASPVSLFGGSLTATIEDPSAGVVPLVLYTTDYLTYTGTHTVGMGLLGWGEDGLHPIRVFGVTSMGRAFDTTDLYEYRVYPSQPVVTGTPGPIREPIWSWVSTSTGTQGDGRFRYQLDSETGTWSDLTTDTFYAPGATLTTGVHRLYVQETNEWGRFSTSGFFDIEIDLTPPSPPVITGSAFTNLVRPTWSWVAGEGGADIFKYKLLPVITDWVDTTATSFTPGEDLVNGPYDLYLKGSDIAGNWSDEVTFHTVVDTIPPDPPVVTGNAPTEEIPLWSWRPGSGGVDVYQLSLNGEPVFEITLRSWSPGEALPHTINTLQVRQRDEAYNWSDWGSYTIKPLPPVVSGTANTNSLRPTWTWTPGGGGIGVYRVKVAPYFTSWVETGATSYSPGEDLFCGGPYQVEVQEKDREDNWTDSGTFETRIDTKPPAIPIDMAGEVVTANPRPVWTWNPGGGGVGVYHVYLNSVFQMETVLQGFKPSVDLGTGTYTISVYERDQFINFSGPGSFTTEVDRDPATFSGSYVHSIFGHVVNITFSEGVWGSCPPAAGMISTGCFLLVFRQNGGTATGAFISALSGYIPGGSFCQLTISVTGVISGVETIEIVTNPSGNIFDRVCNRTLDSCTTGQFTLTS